MMEFVRATNNKCFPWRPCELPRKATLERRRTCAKHARLSSPSGGMLHIDDANVSVRLLPLVCG